MKFKWASNFKILVMITGVMLIIFMNGLKSARAEHLRWTPYSIEGDRFIQLENINSIDDFTVYTQHGYLYQFKKDHFVQLCQPPNIKFAYIAYYNYAKCQFAIAIDDEYNSTSFRKEGNRWINEGLIAGVPVRHFIEDGNGNYYIYGDWGEILQRQKKDKKWEKINSPITKHFITAITYNGAIWFGTRSEGLWEFRDGVFTRLPVPDTDYVDVNGLYIDYEEKIQVRLSDGRIYRWDGDTFTLLETHYVHKHGQNKTIKHGLAFLKGSSNNIELWQKNKWSRLLIPINTGFIDFYRFDDESSIAISANGDVYVGKKDSNLYFYNLASHYRLSGNLQDNTIQAAFLNLNHDERIDLIALNEDFDIFNQVYMNHFPDPFIEVSSQLGISNGRNDIAIALGDLNNDRYTDVLIVRATSDGQEFQVYENIFGYRFNERKPIKENIPSRYRLGSTHLFDYDKDGDLDIYLVYYYGEGKNLRGKNLILENHLWGNFKKAEIDTVLEAHGWNYSSISADFNNDDILDYYIINRWMSNSLLLSENGKIVDKSFSAFNKEIPYNSKTALSMDVDVDGDLDILIITEKNLVWLFINDGNGQFTEMGEEYGISDYFSDHEMAFLVLKCADFNNDGYSDLLWNEENGLETNVKTGILLNINGKYFEPVEDIGLDENEIIKSHITGDIDNDGDIDIFSARRGSNSLYVNQLNSKNYLNIHVNGIVSNTEGKHAKVWLYEPGFIGEKQKLIGYQQVGSAQFDPGFYNASDAGYLHFGTGDINKVDVVVRFYGGREKILKDVNVGQVISVNEYNGLLKLLYPVPAYVITLLRNRNIQIYLLVIIVTALVLLTSVQVAVKLLKWNITAIIFLMLGNLTSFWIIILLSSNSQSYLRYFVPFIFVLIGTSVPLLLFYSFRLKNSASRSQLYENMLKQLLIFGHGEWALGNLNSLKRLVEFISVSKRIDAENVIQLKDRIETYTSMTHPNLNEIVKMGKELNLAALEIETIRNTSQLLENELGRMISSDVSLWSKADVIKSEIPKAIDEIRHSLRQLKDLVYKDYSCDVAKVVKQTLDELEKERVSLKINPPVINVLDKQWVLIKGYELAGILDNSIRNSFLAMKEQPIKNIQLTVEKSGQRVLIIIRDSGSGIEESIQERIFESGYSARGGTGLGLAQAKEILKKYGGNIYLKESRPGKGSTFVVQLNEGREKSETTGSYR